MHGTDPGRSCFGNRDHCRIAFQASHVVDDFSTGLQSGARHFSFGRIDRNRDVRLSCQFLDHRSDSAKFLVGRNRLAVGASAFATDIKYVGSIGNQFQSVFDGRGMAVVIAAIGKTVGRDVDDPHDGRQFAKLQLTGFQLPGVW